MSITSIDPNLLNILLGLITNGLTSLISSSSQKAGELLIGKEFQEKWEREKTALEPLLHKAVVSVAENVKWKGPAREEVVSLFLLSPEAEETVRQIYSTKFARGKKRDRIASIGQVFLTSFTRFVASYSDSTHVREGQLEECASILLEALIQQCDLVLASATDKGVLAAHEAKSSLRHHIIVSELEAIQKKLDFLSGQQNIDLHAVLDFEKKYRQQVGNTHSHITPPNFDSARKLPIDDLFVSPRFYPVTKRKEDHAALTMDAFLNRAYRAVLLGNPGGGKSTFSHKLCHDLATHYSHLMFAGRRHLTPILVVLREYGADKKELHCSILEFIEMKAKTTYQLTPPPLHTFEYLLLNGRAMVIFDGLDELLDTSYRQDIRNDVEAFCHLYPSVPVLVTSREVGYEQAPLDETMFETFRLAEFNDKQIAEYVSKWFNAEDREITQRQRQAKVEAFLSESTVVPDLRSNPLILALLCNIYRGENYIPRNRPEVYDKCAVMLFERWDRSRGLYAPPLLEEHMRPLMEYLAQWIFADEGLRKGVTSGELVAKATEYLHEWVFDSIRKAERIAQDFIQFCTGGRAWVFLDTGTKREGEILYQFAHATFLEYFTAAFFVGTYRTPEDLVKVLRPRIAKREWDVMAQLAFQLQSKRIAGAADELLTALITVLNTESYVEGQNLLSFAARCLQFLAPRPRVARKIAEVSVERIVLQAINGRKSRATKRFFQFAEQNLELFVNLINSTFNNYEVISEAFEKKLIEYIEGERDAETLIAIEIFSLITLFHSENKEKRVISENMINHILTKCRDRLIQLAPKHFDVCFDAVKFGVVDIADLMRWHKINSLLRARILPLFEVGVGSIHNDLFHSILDDEGIDNTNVNNLKKISNILISSPTPWFNSNLMQNTTHYPIPHLFLNQGAKDQQNWDADLLFGITIILLAPMQELGFLPDEAFEKSSYPILKVIGQILIARFRQVPADRVQAEMDKCSFSLIQQSFIWRWVRGEINLVLQDHPKDAEAHK